MDNERRRFLNKIIICKGAVLEKQRDSKVTQSSQATTTPGPEERREGETAGTGSKRESRGGVTRRGDPYLCRSATITTGRDTGDAQKMLWPSDRAITARGVVSVSE